MIREAIEKLFNSAEKITPLMEKLEKLKNERYELEKEIDELKENGAKDLKNIVEQIKIITNDELEKEILQTAKNSVKTKTGRVEIKYKYKHLSKEDEGIFILTRNRLSTPFYLSGQARYDVNLSKFSVLRDNIVFENYFDNNIIFPIDEFLNHSLINKEHFIKFTEFLRRYISEFKDKEDDDYEFNYPGIRIYDCKSWNSEQEKYIKELLLTQDKVTVPHLGTFTASFSSAFVTSNIAA